MYVYVYEHRKLALRIRLHIPATPAFLLNILNTQ